jgi:hypothetical protein
MSVPFILFVLSLAGAAASVWVNGPDFGFAFLICAISAVAAGLLILRGLVRVKARYIVVDGSNVMHWRNETPSMKTVQLVVGRLIEQGFVPVVWFDANVGYKIGDHYLGPYPLSRMLGVSVRQVFVAPKGTPADPLLLNAAKALSARVITNDRFRDWVDSHPQIKEAGFLVQGTVQGNAVTLESDALVAA